MIDGSKKQIALIAFMMFFLGVEAGGYQYVLLYIASEFQLGSIAMGNLVAIQFLAMLIMPMLFGHYADQKGKKKATGIACVFLVIGCMLAVASPNAKMLYVAIFLVGTGYCVCEGTSMAALSDAFPGDSSRFLNITQGFFSLGAIISPLFADYAIRRFGISWRIVFITVGGAFLLLLLLLMRTPYKSAVPKCDTCTDMQGQFSSRPTFSFRRFLRFGFIGLALSIFVYSGLENGIAYFLGLFMESISASAYTSWSISLFWLAMVASRFLYGCLRIKPNFVLLCCYLMVSLAIVLLFKAGHISLILILCAVTGFFLGPIWPTLMSKAVEQHPDHSATASSIMVTGCGLGGAVFTSLTGVIVEKHEVRISFLCMSMFSLIGGLFYLIHLGNMRKHQQKTTTVKT